MEQYIYESRCWAETRLPGIWDIPLATSEMWVIIDDIGRDNMPTEEELLEFLGGES